MHQHPGHLPCFRNGILEDLVRRLTGKVEDFFTLNVSVQPGSGDLDFHLSESVLEGGRFRNDSQKSYFQAIETEVGSFVKGPSEGIIQAGGECKAATVGAVFERANDCLAVVERELLCRLSG